MITEDYCSDEVAKLLKEKGFNEPVTELNRLLFKKGKKPVLKITHQKAMKWLRKEHKLHIQIWILEDKGYWFNIEKILNAKYKHKSLYSTGIEGIYFESSEEACEAAIRYCLENLI